MDRDVRTSSKLLARKGTHKVGIYNEAARIDERKKANEVKLKTARPKDCSFQPNVSVRRKRPTEGKAMPEYYDRIKKSNVDMAKTDRFTLLYVEGEEDRKVERLKIKKQFNDQHVASPAWQGVGSVCVW